MKPIASILATAFTLPLLMAPSLKAGEAQNTKSSKPAATATPPLVIVNEEFGKFFNLDYSHTLGLAIYRSGHLYDSRVDSDLTIKDGKLGEQLRDKINDKLTEVARGAGGILITDYSKLNLGRMLRFKDDTGSAVLFRLRDKFQILNEESHEATYTYLDDIKNNDSGSRVQAAAMFDIYPDWLYNRRWASPLGIIKQPYRFWMRTGFEVNYNNLPGAQEVDQKTVYGLLNFQANPDQDARLFTIPGLEITSPQIIQLGAVFERNEISGEDGAHWIAGWTPIFHLKEDHLGLPLKGFGLNKPMFFGKPDKTQKIVEKTEVTRDGVTTTAVEVEPLQEQKLWHLTINPHTELLGESDVRGVVKRLGKVRSAKDLEKLRDAQFQWKVVTALAYGDGRFSISHTIEGSHPISNLGESHIGQELRMEYDLIQHWTGDMRNWHNINLYVSYKKGQFDPTFEDVETFTAGAAIKF